MSACGVGVVSQVSEDGVLEAHRDDHVLDAVRVERPAQHVDRVHRLDVRGSVEHVHPHEPRRIPDQSDQLDRTSVGFVHSRRGVRLPGDARSGRGRRARRRRRSGGGAQGRRAGRGRGRGHGRRARRCATTSSLAADRAPPVRGRRRRRAHAWCSPAPTIRRSTPPSPRPCRAAGVWVNSADDPANCTFALPAVARAGTGGGRRRQRRRPARRWPSTCATGWPPRSSTNAWRPPPTCSPPSATRSTPPAARPKAVDWAARLADCSSRRDPRRPPPIRTCQIAPTCAAASGSLLDAGSHAVQANTSRAAPAMARSLGRP